jgi:peroxiredoxin
MLIGPDGSVAVSYDEVKPADHPAQVLADLDGLK